MNKVSYEDYLKQNGSLIYKNTGVSMLPLLKQGRDAFIVRAKADQEDFKQWDVVMYKRPPDQYVLHRIIRVHEDSYDILGDNCIGIERNIPKEYVLAVMTEYIRKGKTHSVNEWKYRLYVTCWCKPYHLRIFIKKRISRICSIRNRVWKRIK